MGPVTRTQSSGILLPASLVSMAPMKAMKAMKKSGAKAMTKGGLAEALAAQTELKKVGVHEGADQLGRCGRAAGEEGGEVRAPGAVHGEDAPEAGHEGGQAGGLREGGDGEGEAGQDHREGLPRGRLEEEHLRWRS